MLQETQQWSSAEIRYAVRCWHASVAKANNNGHCDALTTAPLQRLLQKLNQNLKPEQQNENLQLLCMLQNLFSFTLSDAPGVVLLGGTVAYPQRQVPVSVSGSGFTAIEALNALLGEIAESRSYLLPLLPENRPAGKSCTLEDCPTALRTHAQWFLQQFDRRSSDNVLHSADYGVTGIDATNLIDHSVSHIPQAMCRNNAALPASLPPLSEGAASHPDPQLALQSAVCEKLERDALTRWWFGGLPPRETGSELQSRFAHCLLQCGARQSERTDLLLDLSNDWGPPVFAVLTHEVDGFGLAMGIACAFDAERAIRRAVLESRQMELALALSRHNRTSRGAAALRTVEINTLRRAEEINLYRSTLCQSGRPPRPAAVWNADSSVAQLALAIKQRGVDLFCVDLSLQSTVRKVLKVISPQLQSPASVNARGPASAARHSLAYPL